MYFKWLLKKESTCKGWQRAHSVFRPDHKGHIRSPKGTVPLRPCQAIGIYTIAPHFCPLSLKPTYVLTRSSQQATYTNLQHIQMWLVSLQPPEILVDPEQVFMHDVSPRKELPTHYVSGRRQVSETSETDKHYAQCKTLVRGHLLLVSVQCTLDLPLSSSVLGTYGMMLTFGMF